MADVPDDLVLTEEIVEEKGGWAYAQTSTDLEREVILSTRPALDPRGHGISGPQSSVRVQEWAATRTDGQHDTTLFAWEVREEPSGCRYWSVTTVGLSESEVSRLLDTLTRR